LRSCCSIGSHAANQFTGPEADLRDLRRYAGVMSGASASPIIQFASRFMRTIILSHVLAPVDLGAAIALVAIVGTCEQLADVGLTQFVMINVGAAGAQAVASARQILIVRGVLISASIMLLAPLIGELFGARDQVASIRWLSIVPLLGAFKNLRTSQIQSEYRYKPEIVANGVASGSALLLVFPAAAWFQDERAMLVSLIAEAALFAVVSHIVLRPERVSAVDPTVRRAALKYGLPLMVSGIGGVLASQADRIIVSNLFGLELLAHYTVAIGLAMVPISVLALVLGKMLVAFTARSRNERTEPRDASLIVAWVPFVLAACYSIAVGALLDLAVPLLYGDRYQVTAELQALVTIMVFLRTSRMGAGAILLGYGQTVEFSSANLMAGLGLAVGFALGITFRRLDAVLFGVMIGDAASLLTMLYCARSHLPMLSAGRHLALLLLPAVLSSAGTFARSAFELEIRSLIFAIGAAIIGFDVVVVYRRNISTLLANRETGSAAISVGRPAAAPRRSS
jgi:O-antigen/teichoic acid export membrane protein